jgi:hypothetical protein
LPDSYHLMFYKCKMNVHNDEFYRTIGSLLGYIQDLCPIQDEVSASYRTDDEIVYYKKIQPDGKLYFFAISAAHLNTMRISFKEFAGLVIDEWKELKPQND